MSLSGKGFGVNGSRCRIRMISSSALSGVLRPACCAIFTACCRPESQLRYDAGMSFISVLFALLLEQARPLSRGNMVHASVRSWVRWSARNFDAGMPFHGGLAWGFAVLGPSLMALGVY